MSPDTHSLSMRIQEIDHIFWSGEQWLTRFHETLQQLSSPSHSFTGKAFVQTDANGYLTSSCKFNVKYHFKNSE